MRVLHWQYFQGNTPCLVQVSYFTPIPLNLMRETVEFMIGVPLFTKCLDGIPYLGKILIFRRALIQVFCGPFLHGAYGFRVHGHPGNPFFLQKFNRLNIFLFHPEPLIQSALVNGRLER